MHTVSMPEDGLVVVVLELIGYDVGLYTCVSQQSIDQCFGRSFNRHAVEVILKAAEHIHKADLFIVSKTVADFLVTSDLDSVLQRICADLCNGFTLIRGTSALLLLSSSSKVGSRYSTASDVRIDWFLKMDDNTIMETISLPSELYCDGT